ncbi:MAG: iron ABC transporter permease [Chloroflexi bacterium]|nr:iron ABC transporter permease [Chloroflexota bacterium]
MESSLQPSTSNLQRAMALALHYRLLTRSVHRGRLPDPAAVLALPMLLPLGYLVWLALQARLPDLALTLARMELPTLVLRMALLAGGATLLAFALAVPWAWLVTRTDVPGRRLFQALGPLPLAVPPYVGAIAYAALLAPTGLVHEGLARLVGLSTSQVLFPPLLYSPAGAAFVLGVFSAPYVFITVQSALERSSPALEESARSLGLSPAGVFWRVTLPLLRPALLAGGFLVFLYAWVDFGVVSLLRVRTFTTVIYNQLLAGLSLPDSAGSSLALLVMVGLLLLLVQRWGLGGARYTQVGSQRSSVGLGSRRQPLGRWKLAALAYLLGAVALTLALPLAVLATQASKLGPLVAAGFLAEQWPFVRNSLAVAATGAWLALGLALVTAWGQWKGRGGLPGAILQAGYAIPGTVLGLSLVGLSLALLPGLYGTAALLAVAYLVLFAGPAHQAAQAALSQIAPAMEEAARVLGRTPLGAAREVVLPLASPGLAGAWLMAFILSIRELAATLVLRPPGFDTLPVRIWVHTMDVGVDPRASVVALLLIALVGLGWLAVLLVRPRSSPVALG